MSANGPYYHSAARDQIASGLRYTHFRADANTSKLLEVPSFLYAAIALNRVVNPRLAEPDWPRSIMTDGQTLTKEEA
jgi:hypothetical protein